MHLTFDRIDGARGDLRLLASTACSSSAEIMLARENDFTFEVCNSKIAALTKYLIA